MALVVRKVAAGRSLFEVLSDSRKRVVIKFGSWAEGLSNAVQLHFSELIGTTSLPDT